MCRDNSALTFTNLGVKFLHITTVHQHIATVEADAQKAPAALKSWINKGINILVVQSSIWLWVMFSFSVVSSVGVNTVVNLAMLDRVVAMVAIATLVTLVIVVIVVIVVSLVTLATVVIAVIRVMIQLCIFY
ncbi:hypothetical protein F2P81_014827 [Scophthalmus maximus]|uniref:Uncharacterized protein n=1 Tax=Scophthalmus maximus TaxID=52904 RepID=A0A6A4SH47_SCOMX|nr:hypothetical protein F2P81_014827 [Scophthalmus maximus]